MLVPDFHEAEDLLQNVAVVLLRKFHQYDPNQSFTAWAIGISRYEILARRRVHARSRLVLTPELAEQAAELCEELRPELDARQRALRDCLPRLGDRASEVVRLRYQDALSPQEIAQRLGASAGAIRVMLNRIRGTLQTCIERHLAATGERP